MTSPYPPPKPAGVLPDSCYRTDLSQLFELGEELGRGSFGLVHECTETTTGAPFACKVLEKRRLRCRAPTVRREVDVHLRLTGHPHVVALAGAYEDACNVYMVMERCAAGDLRDTISARPEPLSEPGAAAIFRQLAAAVAFCHSRGVLHRDLKPENVLLAPAAGGVTEAGGGGRPDGFEVKLGDFGQAVYLRAGERTEGPCGSLCYLAPEQARGGKYGFEADMWSLGIILCDLLLGRLPYLPGPKDALKQAICDGRVDFETPAWARVSPLARALARKLLALNCWQRPTAGEILSDPWLTANCQLAANAAPGPLVLPPISKPMQQGAGACSAPLSRQLSECHSGTKGEHDQYAAERLPSFLAPPPFRAEADVRWGEETTLCGGLEFSNFSLCEATAMGESGGVAASCIALDRNGSLSPWEVGVSARGHSFMWSTPRAHEAAVPRGDWSRGGGGSTATVDEAWWDGELGGSGSELWDSMEDNEEREWGHGRWYGENAVPFEPGSYAAA